MGLHFSRPRPVAEPVETPTVCENLEAIKSVFVNVFPDYGRLLGL